jgi:ATP-binding cassette subfamily F protein 3
LQRRKLLRNRFRRFRFNAKRASLVQSRIKAMERMEDLAEIINDPEVKLDIPQPEDMPAPPIIQVSLSSIASLENQHLTNSFLV